MPASRPAGTETGRPLRSARFAFAGALCAAALAAACHMDYGDGVEAKSLSAATPDTVLENSQVEVVRDGVRAMTMHFERAEVYAAAGKRVMTKVSFVQYDRDGAVSAQGSAGRAEQSIQTDDVDFSQGLTVDIVGQDAKVEAEALQWQAQAKRLQGTATQRVKISRKDGSAFDGFGLAVDFAARSVELSGGVEGSLVHD